MAYERQVQIAMDRLDQSLARLRDMIKRGENAAAIQYMEEGDLKENMIWCNKIYKQYIKHLDF